MTSVNATTNTRATLFSSVGTTINTTFRTADTTDQTTFRTSDTTAKTTFSTVGATFNRCFGAADANFDTTFDTFANGSAAPRTPVTDRYAQVAACVKSSDTQVWKIGDNSQAAHTYAPHTTANAEQTPVTAFSIALITTVHVLTARAESTRNHTNCYYHDSNKKDIDHPLKSHQPRQRSAATAPATTPGGAASSDAQTAFDTGEHHRSVPNGWPQSTTDSSVAV